jgi:hypothetical protein
MSATVFAIASTNSRRVKRLCARCKKNELLTSINRSIDQPSNGIGWMAHGPVPAKIAVDCFEQSVYALQG